MMIRHIKTHSTTLAAGRGFTIVETLVAITVLMIAIAGPLVIASKGLTSALYARDQMIASLLAQESMEIIKGVRSNNIATIPAGSVPWDRSLARDNSNNSICTQSAPCDASTLLSTSPPIKTDCPYSANATLNGCPLYFSSGYTPGGGDATLFRRYFYLTQATGPTASTEYTVNVVVTWNQGMVPNELRLSSQLTNSTR